MSEQITLTPEQVEPLGNPQHNLRPTEQRVHFAACAMRPLR
ncbi:hypothetical protein [Nocardia macrotermitis]|nr:hypothetical protein [Nocardia macrotermitis]